jgi:2-polyprenyl-6-methoxyphenol hydroxylase-like FAD-dependent oxidoreductase
MPGSKVLISGAGIAGPTLAFWLNAAGFATTIVEQAPALRTGGYVIDFWGLGYDIAERMGLAAAIDRVGYRMRELRIVDAHGRRTAGFGTAVFRELTGGRYVTLARSDLSRLLFETIKDRSELLFGDEIIGLDDRPDSVAVRLKHAGERRFDLVIGADGQHSAVRRLAFGPEVRFEKRLGYVVAAFEARGYRPRDEDVYVMFGQPGRMVGRVSLHDDRVLFLLVLASAGTALSEPHDLATGKALLRDSYRGCGWECARILDELDRTEDLYFDDVGQIVMDDWSNGRVALVGDAASCPSLLAGQGSALAMTASYVLAGELARCRDDHVEAFRSYQKTLRAFIASKQRAAVRFAAAFAPRTRWGLVLRNQVIRLLAIPGLGRRLFGADILDRLALPDYPWSAFSVAES